MGEKVDCFSSPPSPSLVFIHGEDAEFMTFCPLAKDGDYLEKEVPLELRNKEIRYELGCDHWLIVWIEDEIHDDDDQYRISFSLRNALAMDDSIDFPELELELGQEIKHRFLTAPPGNPNCMLILFEMTYPSLIYCREGDSGWTKQLVDDKIGDSCFHSEFNRHKNRNGPVMCNGRIYIDWYGGNHLAVIDIKPKGDDLDLCFLEFSNEDRRKGGWLFESHMVESCGELFQVCLFSNNNWKEVCDVEIFKADFSRKEWHRVESFEDKAFFLSTNSKFSCPTNRSKIKGNHVYFILGGDTSLYKFDMEDETISYSFPLPTFPELWTTSFWLMPMPTDPVPKKRSDQVLKTRNNDSKSNLNEEEEDAFSKLASELIFEIGKRLPLPDYTNLRAVNTIFRSAAPLIPSPPLLMTTQMSQGVWKFIDPIHKNKYFRTHDDKELKDARMCYTKEGWCVILHDAKNISLWNPFAKKSIVLPVLPINNYMIEGCSFSSSPDSQESDCIVAFILNYHSWYCISFIKLGDEKWRSHTFNSVSELYTVRPCNYHIFFKGTVYFLDEEGKLGVYREGEEEEEDHGVNSTTVLNHVIQCPVEKLHQKYLLECDGKLISIFVEFLGDNVQIFELDESKMEWVGLETLGNHTIYVSCVSSFSTVASPRMQNRIYFPRYYGERSMIYYSLQSRKLHSHDNDEVLENFYDTKEQVSSGWIIPTF